MEIINYTAPTLYYSSGSSRQDTRILRIKHVSGEQSFAFVPEQIIINKELLYTIGKYGVFIKNNRISLEFIPPTSISSISGEIPE